MASASAADNDLHVRNGLYLANLKLGRNDAAIKAFGNIVDFGMANDELAINFLFNAGSAVFPPDKRMYSSWLREIARRVTQTDRCLEVVGHTSPSGAEPLNQRLSLERAEYIKKLLETELGSLPGRVTARGAGSRENLVGTGKDDLSDSLDRRIVFRLVPCTSTGTQTAHR